MTAYTLINLGLLNLALVLRAKRVYGVLFSNSVAVATSFAAGQLMDSTCRRRLIEWSGYSPWGFAVRDVLGHLGPVVLLACITDTRDRRIDYPGFVSLVMHLAWLAVIGDHSEPFDLSHVYVHMTPTQWRWIWAIAIAAHLSAVPALRTVKRAFKGTAAAGGLLRGSLWTC